MSRLEKARAALEGTSTPTSRRSTAGRPKRRRTSTGTGRRGRPRGSGTRAKEALQLGQKRPGIPTPEPAKKRGIKQNYLYRVVPPPGGGGQAPKKDRGGPPVAW